MSSNMKKSSNGARRNRRSTRATQRIVPHPTQFQSTITSSRKARFSGAVAATAVPLTRGQLLNHLFVNASSGTTNWRLLSAIKINRIEIWTPGTSAFVPATCYVEWISEQGPTKIVSDTSITTECAYVNTTPPPRSLAGFWSVTGTAESDVLCILNIPVNSIVDLSYSYVLQNGETPVQFTSTNNGVAGTVYMNTLFGDSNGDVVPVSYSTLF